MRLKTIYYHDRISCLQQRRFPIRRQQSKSFGEWGELMAIPYLRQLFSTDYCIIPTL